LLVRTTKLTSFKDNYNIFKKTLKIYQSLQLKKKSR
jgi:hypothetical protein